MVGRYEHPTEPPDPATAQRRRQAILAGHQAPNTSADTARTLLADPQAPVRAAALNALHRLNQLTGPQLTTGLNDPAAAAKAQTRLPVMWDIVSSATSGRAQFNHVPGGANALYMDGHVQFNRYPGEFPASKSFAAVAAFF